MTPAPLLQPIPDDLRAAASAIVHDASRYDSIGDFFRDDMVNDIAEALMAERERCAQISIAMCSHRLPAWADDIAAAIRKGTP